MGTSKTPEISMSGHARDTPVCMSSLCWEKNIFLLFEKNSFDFRYVSKDFDSICIQINKIYLKFVLIY